MNLGEAVRATGISSRGYKLVEDGCIDSVHYGMKLLSSEEVQVHLIKLAEYIAELENK